MDTYVVIRFRMLVSLYNKLTSIFQLVPFDLANPDNPSPVTQDLVDFLYEAIVKVYTNTREDIGDGDNSKQDDVAEDRILDGQTFTDLLTSTLTNSPERILDGQTLTNLISSIDLGATFTTLSGIFGVITSQLDVLTAISLVKHLENRAMYDPR